MKSNDLSTITNLSKNFKTLKQVNVLPSDTFYAWQNKHKKKETRKPHVIQLADIQFF